MSIRMLCPACRISPELLRISRAPRRQKGVRSVAETAVMVTGEPHPVCVPGEAAWEHLGVACRDMAADDAAWAAEVMERRRRIYARYSPVFWRPAPNAAGLHTRFLARQIASEGTIALRTGHGFIVCQRRNGEGFVDDFAVEDPAAWQREGAALLLATAQRLSATGESAVRVVTAHADRPKADMLASLSLHLAEQWWVAELRPAAGEKASYGRRDGAGFSGIFAPAPPVYDPGGPVLLADRVHGDARIDSNEREAAALGAVLAVVPAVPGSARAGELARGGWEVASDWYLGWPTTEGPGSHCG